MTPEETFNTSVTVTAPTWGLLNHPTTFADNTARTSDPTSADNTARTSDRDYVDGAIRASDRSYENYGMWMLLGPRIYEVEF